MEPAEQKCLETYHMTPSLDVQLNCITLETAGVLKFLLLLQLAYLFQYP